MLLDAETLKVVLALIFAVALGGFLWESVEALDARMRERERERRGR